MARPEEPMDIDSDFDNKENTFHHNSVLPCTEKGYEELDVSELNMKLRYSITPAASPMSKSYTNCTDHRNLDLDDSLNLLNENNLTRSLNSTMRNDNAIKSLKTLPLQILTTDSDYNRNTSVLRQLDSTIMPSNNVTVTISGTNDIDENLSLPSSSSSAIHTPEATTPVQETPKSEEGSPIMRGLKSVLNMFRSSQSPIPPADTDNAISKHEVLSPAETSLQKSEVKDDVRPQTVLASTPIAAHRNKETNGSKRNSPYKDSIVFNEDLEKELQWKDETTIIFSHEKIPIHKLFLQQTKSAPRIDVESKDVEQKNVGNNLNSTVEYMDISCDDSLIEDKTMTEQPDCNKGEVLGAMESDSEFLDCETTFTKNEVADNNDTEMNIANNISCTDLKELSSTKKEEIVDLDATVEIQNEVSILSNINKSGLSMGQTEDTISKNIMIDSLDVNNSKHNIITVCDLPESGSVILNATYESHSPVNVTDNTSTHDSCTGAEQECLEITKMVGEKSAENDAQTLQMTKNNKILTSIYELDSLEYTQNDSNVNESVNASEYNLASIMTSIINQCTDSSQCTDAKNVLTNELPVDVPLPDEDDFEKDSTMPVEDLTTAIGRFPPDIVDSISTNENQATDLVHPFDTEQNSENNVTIACVNKEPEIMPLFNVTIEDDCILKSEENAANLSEVIKDVETLLACEQITSTNNISQIIKTQDSLLVGTNESMTEMQILPDLINETVIISNQDSIENIDLSKSLGCGLLPPTPATQNEPVIDVASNPENVSKSANIIKCKEMTLPDCSKQIQEFSNFPIEQNIIIDSLINPEQISTIADLSKSVGHIQPYSDMPVNQNEIVDMLAKADVSIVEENNVQENLELDNSKHLQCKSDCPKEQNEPIQQATNSEVTSTSSVENSTKLILPSPIEQRQCGTSVSEIEQNKITEGFENQRTAVTSLPECLEEVQHDCNGNTNNICKDMSKSKCTAVVEKIMIPYDIDHPQNVTDSQTVKNVSGNVNIQLEPPTNSPEHHTETIRYLDNDVQHSKRLVNEIGDQNRELTEVILFEEKVMKVTEGAKTQNVEVQDQSYDAQLEQLEENNCELNSTVILQQNEVDKQATNVHKQTHDFIEQHMKPDILQTNYEGDIKVDNQNIGNIKASEIKKEDLKTATSDLALDTKLYEYHKETVKTDNIDDEIVVSENNSPYVSVAADLNIISEMETFNNIQEADPFLTRTNIPSSPPITSKGYNFNFDEIGDPFATKTKIRMSPGPDTPEKPIESVRDNSEKKTDTYNKNINKNNRKSHPQRKKPVNIKMKHNTSVIENPSILKFTSKNIDDALPETTKLEDVEATHLPNPEMSQTMEKHRDSNNRTPTLGIVDNKLDETNIDETTVTSSEIHNEKLHETVWIEENKISVESVTKLPATSKNSSSDHSTYYSAGASSNESFRSRNVFNLPEIDDMNFNPFATKSRILQSPPPNPENDDHFDTGSKIRPCDISLTVLHDTKVEEANNTINIKNPKIVDETTYDKMETEAMEKDSTINNTTCSSDTTNEKDNTIREIHTEDEDTIEGPFLEAEDLDNIDKMSNIDSQDVDMMQFNELPPPDNEETGDGELFIDAEAFEFLLNQNKSNMVADSGKESLFLKFDPLFAKRMSSDVVTALSKINKRQSTPTKVTKHKKDMTSSPVAGPSKLNVTYETDFNNTGVTEDLNITVSKPMMVVTPAVNPTAMPRKSLTPTRSNRRSITFTSPAMAVIDRLLSLSANNSFVENEAMITQASREQHEADFALVQLRELLAEKEINVYNLRSESKELKDRLSTLESQIKILESEGQHKLQKINDLNEKLTEKTKINKSMAAVVEEYERTIASLIAETEQDKNQHADERRALISERDEQTAHLASMEVAFNDLHSKYEKSKQVIMSYKANEDKYKKSLDDFEKTVAKMQTNYESLKQHATSKLNHANDELQKINKAHESEILKMNAMIKRKELHITSLEETLAHKTKANEELTAICDELINKVG